MKEHIQQKIISLCGSQTELARRLGKNSQTVSVWFRTQVVTNIRGRSRCCITSASKCAELVLSVR